MKRWRRRILVNLNENAGIQKFIEQLFVYDGKEVFLNIVLSPGLICEFKNFNSISLSQIYRSKNISGGFRVKFNCKNNDQLLYDKFIEPNRIKGYFRIMHEAGPELGWYTILLQY